MTTKIAFPTDDGETISRHFGQAAQFKVLTLSDGRLGPSELRDKASHRHDDHAATGGTHPGQQMVGVVSDCQVVISGGMGAPMLARLEAAGLKVYLTRERSISAAAEAYLGGTLQDDRRLVHQHHEHQA
jgi:predicted Fe-Mo cluster-binding NifX family protein